MIDSPLIGTPQWPKDDYVGHSETKDEEPDCTTPEPGSGEFRGEIIKIDKVDVYISKPNTTTQTAIIIFSDIFGLGLTNIKLIADAFAEAGFLCVVPDLFDGGSVPIEKMEPLEADTSKMTLGQKLSNKVNKGVVMLGMIKHSPLKAASIASLVIDNLKKEYNITRVYGQGYSFGASALLKLMSQPDTIQAACLSHPTNFVYPNDIQTIKTPRVLFQCAEEDEQFDDKKRIDSEKMMNGRDDVKSQFVLFHGAKNGFAIRGNEPEVSRHALIQAISFFSE
ncbi:hydrolase [Acrasis kona]|uniref:Hydrolase n=1 Tax=Acrasis kona TaxID=1008807 RepID=A0AAW2Z9M0_9EUKA